MATKQLNVVKVKGTTSSGMQFEMSGNVAGICQELFNYIENHTMRSRVIDAIVEQHLRMVEREAMAKREEAALKRDLDKPQEHSTSCLATGGGPSDDDCICDAGKKE